MQENISHDEVKKLILQYLYEQNLTYFKIGNPFNHCKMNQVLFIKKNRSIL